MSSTIATLADRDTNGRIIDPWHFFRQPGWVTAHQFMVNPDSLKISEQEVLDAMELAMPTLAMSWLTKTPPLFPCSMITVTSLLLLIPDIKKYLYPLRRVFTLLPESRVRQELSPFFPSEVKSWSRRLYRLPANWSLPPVSVFVKNTAPSSAVDAEPRGRTSTRLPKGKGYVILSPPPTEASPSSPTCLRRISSKPPPESEEEDTESAPSTSPLPLQNLRAPSGSKQTPAKPTGTIVVPWTGVTTTSSGVTSASSSPSKQRKGDKTREEASGSSASHAGESSKGKAKGKGKALPPPKTPSPAHKDSEMRDSPRASPAAGPSLAAERIPEVPGPVPSGAAPAEASLFTEPRSPASFSLCQLLATRTLVVTEPPLRRNLSQYQIFAAINSAQNPLRDLDAQFEPMHDENWPVLLEYAEPPAHPGAPPPLDETGIPPAIEPLRDATPPPLPPGHPDAATCLAERRAVKDAHFAHEEHVLAHETERVAWRVRATVDQEVVFFTNYNERRDTFEWDCTEIDWENKWCRGARERVMQEILRMRGQVDLWVQQQAAAAACDEDLRNIRWHQARLLDEFRCMDLERRAHFRPPIYAPLWGELFMERKYPKGVPI
ncbi:hypothetical protein DFH07DRAFT_949971 [Mycena maculata]|uniref:Uncharacterized protein n=1 Tax=Mycena maculata TaxID=230809 RepID=A0AAD7NYX3_9AGAR|nr:hypothetical protein DFH07DRAFT_949971 [Mycena maculata]